MWKSESERHQLASKGIKTNLYKIEPSILKSKRNIHQLTPLFETKKEFDEYALRMYLLIYEQAFRSSYSQIHGVHLGDSVFVEKFYWKKDTKNRWELLFKETIKVSDITDVEQFKKYTNGEMTKMR